jgi:hypothetical protein
MGWHCCLKLRPTFLLSLKNQKCPELVPGHIFFARSRCLSAVTYWLLRCQLRR